MLPYATWIAMFILDFVLLSMQLKTSSGPSSNSNRATAQSQSRHRADGKTTLNIYCTANSFNEWTWMEKIYSGDSADATKMTGQQKKVPCASNETVYLNVLNVEQSVGNLEKALYAREICQKMGFSGIGVASTSTDPYILLKCGTISFGSVADLFVKHSPKSIRRLILPHNLDIITNVNHEFPYC